MEGKYSLFSPKGMQRDLSRSKFNPEYAYELKNMRITSRGDGTLLSLTNERGQKKILLNEKIPDIYKINIYGNISQYDEYYPEIRNILIYGNINTEEQSTIPNVYDIRLFGTVYEETGSGNTFDVTPKAFALEYNDTSSHTIEVLNTGYSWNVSTTESSWITITSKTDSVVQFSVNRNEGSSLRSGKIVFTYGVSDSIEVNITQQAAAAPQELMLNINNYAFQGTGGTVIVTVSNFIGDWTASWNWPNPYQGATLSMNKSNNTFTLTLPANPYTGATTDNTIIIRTTGGQEKLFFYTQAANTSSFSVSPEQWTLPHQGTQGKPLIFTVQGTNGSWTYIDYIDSIWPDVPTTGITFSKISDTQLSVNVSAVNRGTRPPGGELRSAYINFTWNGSIRQGVVRQVVGEY